MSYDRYTRFRNNGKMSLVPSVKIPTKSTDYFEIYKLGETSLYDLSYKYYDDPNYDWLIMMANPEFSSMEYEIPDQSELRIPYPLTQTLEHYNAMLDKYNLLYGIGE